jgi:hypothetical protein
MPTNGVAPTAQPETWPEMGVALSGDSPFAYLMNMLLYVVSLVAGLFLRR